MTQLENFCVFLIPEKIDKEKLEYPYLLSI